MTNMKTINMKNVEAENLYNLYNKLAIEHHRPEHKEWFIEQLMKLDNYKTDNTYYYHDRDNGINLTINIDENNRPDVVFFSLDWVSPVSQKELNAANKMLANMFINRQ